MVPAGSAAKVNYTRSFNARRAHVPLAGSNGRCVDRTLRRQIKRDRDIAGIFENR
jgi:hypothetical protein